MTRRCFPGHGPGQGDNEPCTGADHGAGPKRGPRGGDARDPSLGTPAVPADVIPLLICRCFHL